MSKGRPLDPEQRNKVVVLSVNDLGVWTETRRIALDRGVPLSTVVEEALIHYVHENVRSANG